MLYIKVCNRFQQFLLVEKKLNRFAPHLNAVLSLFSVVRFTNSACTGDNSYNGTCYTSTECTKYGGTASGTCASGFGVCCIGAYRIALIRSFFSSRHIELRTCIIRGFHQWQSLHAGRPRLSTVPTGRIRVTATLIHRLDSAVSTWQRALRTFANWGSKNKMESWWIFTFFDTFFFSFIIDECPYRLDFEAFSLAQPDSSSTTTAGQCLTDIFSVSGQFNTVPSLCGENANQHSK